MTEPTTNLLRELIELRTSRRSGRVEISAGDLTTTLVLSNGEITRVEASRPGEPLGRILTRKALLTQAQYIDVLERMSGALAIGEKVRFGEVAVELGYVDESAVCECLTEQRRLLASRVFQSVSVTWTFEAAAAAPDASGETPMQVEALFLDAVRWADDTRKAALGLDESRANRLEPAWDFDEIDGRFDLTQDEAAFVQRALAGDRTVAELLEDSSVKDTVDVHAILTALLASGAAAPCARGKPASKPPAARTDARSGPPPSPAWTIDAERAKSALARIVLAKISVPATDDASRPIDQQLRSEQAFLRGKELLRNARTAAALVEFERALELRPESAEYKLFVTWTRHAESTEPLGAAVRGQLETLANAALRHDSKLAFGYFILGEVLRETGDVEEARRQLRHALRLEPGLFAGIRTRRLGGVRASQPSFDFTSEAAGPQPPADVTTAEASPDEAAPAAEASPEEASPAAEASPEAAALAAESPATTRAQPALPAQGPRPVAASTRRPRGRLVALGGIVVAAGLTVALLQLTGARSSTPVASKSQAVPTVPRGPVGAPASAASVASVSSAAVERPRASASSASDASTTGPAAASMDASTTSPAAASMDASAKTFAIADGVADGPRDGGGAGGVVEANANRGVIVLGPRASGHRVFVDGRLATTLDGRVTVSCGRHDVRVGSQGRTAPVDVPCDHEVTLP